MTTKCCRFCASLLLGFCLLGNVFAHTPSIKQFAIHMDQPAYLGLPIWIHADLDHSLEVHYPYAPDLADFGPNRVELFHDGKVVTSVDAHSWPGGSGFAVDGWIAPPGAPTNRLPLHLKYDLKVPGVYSIRWTRLRHIADHGKMIEVVEAQSNWITFELQKPTLQRRQGWLQSQIAKAPSDPGVFVGDYLPSLLAAAPSPRVLQIVMEQVCAKAQVASFVAMASLHFFSDQSIREKGREVIQSRPPCDGLADFFSRHEALFHDHYAQIVDWAIRYLEPVTDENSAAATRVLDRMLHMPGTNWPTDVNVVDRADRAVLATASKIIQQGSKESLQPLGDYLGRLKTEPARKLLWQLAARPEPEHEEALIALTWIHDPDDLVRLGNVLIAPGDPDRYGRDRASLPNGLVLSYGDKAFPILEKAVADSPYPFVRTQSAEQLALAGKASGFQFFLDAVENDRFYKPELENWLKGYFPKDLSPTADDAATIHFLKSRLEK
jgi:hypothetical protein